MNKPKDDGGTSTEHVSIVSEESANSQNDDVLEDNSVDSKNLNENTINICNKCGITVVYEEKIICGHCQDIIQTEKMKIQESLKTYRQDDFTYQTRRGGYALLFNHEKYNEVELARKGTKCDAQYLINVFKDRNINLTHYENYKYVDIMKTIKEVANTDHTDKDCLIVIVLTHGILDKNGEELILASDDVGYPPSELWLPFSDERCPSLAGKPKIFIIQACRGIDDNRAIEAGPSPSSELTKLNNNNDFYYTRARSDPESKPVVFNMPDLLVARSTFIGYKSYRFEDTGTIYIEHLVQLMKDGNSTDLISLLTKVNRYVSRMEIREDNETVLQIPCFTSTLTKKLYL